MRGSKGRLPSPALAISLVALFVALGGTGYAAVRLVPRNSVGSAQVRNGSLQKVDLSKKAVAALKGKAGRRGLQGPPGAAGPAGAQGAGGPAGALGAQGPQGAQGAPGAEGAQGAAGAQGLQGVAGATGPAGPPLGRAPFALTTLDSTGNVGSYTSVTVGTD